MVFWGSFATRYIIRPNGHCLLYSDTGEKTFTMVWNGISYTYTEFIQIINGSSPPLPEIQSNDTNLCINIRQYLYVFHHGRQL